MKTVRFWLGQACLAGAMALLAACASNPVNPRLPPLDSSADFKLGYLHGCREGAADANPGAYSHVYHQYDQRYAADLEYKKGWDQGLKACYEDELRAPRMGGFGGRGMGFIRD